MAAPEGNKYALGNKGGRPPIFKTPKALAKAIDAYFEYIKGEYHLEDQVIESDDDEKPIVNKVKVWDRYPEPATITGLTLYLGFSHRQSLDDYEKRNEFSDIIKRGRTRVEFEYEKRLHGDKNTGAIFALKNMGWRDKIETGLTDNDGNDVPVTIFQIPDNGRNQYQTKDNQTAARVSNEDAGQPG
jgi:hypothetical protein